VKQITLIALMIPGIQNPSLSGTINYVRLIARAKAHLYAQSSSGNYKLSCYDGTSTDYSANQAPLTTTYSKYYGTWETKPSGGAWTWATINSLRNGIQCSSPAVITEGQFIMRPNAVGTINEMLRYLEWVYQGAGDSTNYTYVDEETSDEAATNVRGNSGTFKTDTYHCANHTTESGTINSIELFFRYRCSLTSTPTDTYGSAAIRIGGGYYYGDTENNATKTFENYSKSWATNPAGGDWDWTDVDNLEIGHRGKDYYMGTQVYAVVNYDKSVSPEIRTTQCYAIVNYTPAASVVTLADPKNVDLSHSRRLIRKNLPNGNYIVYDAGRNAKTFTILGTETSGAYSDMEDMKTVCHYGAKVTIAGMDDTNLNGDYWVSDIQFSAGPGYPSNMYDYTLTLEEA
jgi:hypothetical protein